MLFFFSNKRRDTRCALVSGVQACSLPIWPAMPGSLGLRLFDCPCSGPCRGAESSVRTKTLVKPSHCSCNGVPRLDEDGGPADHGGSVVLRIYSQKSRRGL